MFTRRSRILEKVVVYSGSHIPAFYGTWNFICIFSRAQLAFSVNPLHITHCLRSNLILSSNLSWVCQVFLTEFSGFFLSIHIHLNSSWWREEIRQLFIIQFSQPLVPSCFLVKIVSSAPFSEMSFVSVFPNVGDFHTHSKCGHRFILFSFII